MLPSDDVHPPLLRHEGIKALLQNSHHVLLQQLLLHSLDKTFPAADVQVVLTPFKLLCQAPLQAQEMLCTCCLTQKHDAWMLLYGCARQRMHNSNMLRGRRVRRK